MLELNIAYMQAKFDQSSFSRSGDMVGAHTNLNCSRDLTTPLGWFAIRRLARATLNLSNKFHVSISTH